VNKAPQSLNQFTEDRGPVAQQVRRRTRELPVCTFSSDSSDPFVGYVLELLSDFSGVRFEPVSRRHQGHVHIYYGNDRNVDSAIRIPEASQYTLDDIPGIPSAGDFACARSKAPFPFDLFRAVRFWLTDAGNDFAESKAFDQHERLLPTFSAQEKLGTREIPIVNAYLVLMRRYIEERLGTRTQDRLLGDRRCVVVLSHDVENPIANDRLHKLRLAGVALLNRRPRGFAAEIRNALLGGSAERSVQFDEITGAEDEFGFRSTFFFSAVSHREGHPLDIAYDVRAHRFRTIMQRLTERGWEVGVHLSYNARRSSAQIAAERERIERVACCQVLGSRHHYWHMSRPIWKTLEDHEKAGLAYDVSVAFNERPGYRLGIAYPFYPWSPVSQRPVRTLQIPTACMDGSFFYDANLTVDAFVERFATLLESLKRFNGVACIDWHEYTSVASGTTFKKWGEAYLELLKLLAADNSVAVCSCAELLEARNRKEELANSHVV